MSVNTHRLPSVPCCSFCMFFYSSRSYQHARGQIALSIPAPGYRCAFNRHVYFRVETGPSYTLILKCSRLRIFMTDSELKKKRRQNQICRTCLVWLSSSIYICEGEPTLHLSGRGHCASDPQNTQKSRINSKSIQWDTSKTDNSGMENIKLFMCIVVNDLRYPFHDMNGCVHFSTRFHSATS